MTQEGAEPGPGFSPALAARLDALAFSPRVVWRDPRHYWALAKNAADFVAHNLPRWNALLTRVNPYPRPWVRVRVPVDDAGTTLGAWYGPGEAGAPAVLYAPGTFQTKDDTPRKRHAIHLRRAWGYHVLIVDLRGFGESHAAPPSAGFDEAHDLHHAADTLKRLSGASRVVLVGDSLGGASALIAAALPGARERFAGVLAWSPFADLVTQAEYATTNPGPRHPFYVPYNLYRFMVYARTNGEARDFNDFTEMRCRELGLARDAFFGRASPVRYVNDIRVPTLALHAEDDPIVPVAQARLLAEAARANPCVRVRVLPAGGHCAFDDACSEWYWETTRLFIEHLRDAPPAAAAAAATETATRAAGDAEGAAA